MGDTEKKSKYSNIDLQSSQNNDNQAESCRNVIIVNQLPDDIDSNKLLSIFSEFGQIENVYISMEKRKPDSDEAYNHEFARITFNSEEEAASVAKAFQEGKIKYDEHNLMITQTADDCCLIENLPDDCLIEIFLHLTRPQDKLNCELVSKRWNKLAKESWSTITDVSTIKNINIIAPRAGKYLRNVSLPFGYKHDKLQDILTLLAENSKQIQHFHFSYETRIPIDLDLLKSIIRTNKNLRSLELHFGQLIFNSSHNFNLMDVFPTELERLAVFVKDTMYHPLAKPARDISRFKNLQILILERVMVAMTGIENLSNLKELQIIQCEMDLSGLEHLKNLEYLCLRNSSIRDHVFEGIVRSNKKLKFLDISYETEITDASFQFVQQLPELKVLIIEKLENVTETYISNMPTVRFARFTSSMQITDRGFKQFLDTADDIEIIAAFRTNLTVDSIKIANEWTKRTGKSLTVYVPVEIAKEFADLDIERDVKLRLKSDDDYSIALRNDEQIYEKRYSPVLQPLNCACANV